MAEYTGAGALLRRYIPGPGTDQPIAMVTPAGAGHTRSYFHVNRQGSTVAMSNDAGVMAEGPYTYDAYGQGPTSAGVPFKYTGRRLDPETGLYYYRARYYSAALGRFLQTDPMGYGDDMNMYAYVGGDPVNATDPSGSEAVTYVYRHTEEADLGCGDPCSLTRDDVADAVEAIGVAWDVVTLPSGLGSGPEGIAASKIIAAGIRRSADDAAKQAIKWHRHHTVPKEVLRMLPSKVARDPLVRGVAKAPNRWKIPEDLHRQIHSGAGGGRYNNALDRELGSDTDIPVSIR